MKRKGVSRVRWDRADARSPSGCFQKAHEHFPPSRICCRLRKAHSTWRFKPKCLLSLSCVRITTACLTVVHGWNLVHSEYEVSPVVLGRIEIKIQPMSC